MQATSLSLSPTVAGLGLPFFGPDRGLFFGARRIISAATTAESKDPGHLGQRSRENCALAARERK